MTEAMDQSMSSELVLLDKPVVSVLPQDLKTPDKHVPRDKRLIRLTGTHPFNCEAPLTDLYEAGFLTPAALHYVRNHGAVPEVHDDQVDAWSFEVSGLCEKPQTFTLAELKESFPVNTLPVTLVCAGNRRKEQNMVRKGSGFNWGSAGCSTSLWTGTYLFHLLDKVKPSRKAKYVHFEGADLLPNGSYGTCVRIDWANSFERAFMLSWLQNGIPLSPDHGRPLRVILPGIIGGRSVKWLKKIILSDVPSENHYHIYDNRVLPTVVTPEMARLEKKWWADERYAIYDLNIQSVTVFPEHGFTLSLDNDPKQTYKARGYAYNGGGVRVGRVEVSLDRGQTWRLASIRYPEDLYRDAGIDKLFGGKIDLSERQSSYCWCFWEFDVAYSELFGARDFVVRAMDESMNCQPRDMYWNVMSMLNNWWHRIAIIHEPGAIRFEHPIKLHEDNGWMDRVKAQGGNILGANWGESDCVALQNDPTLSDTTADESPKTEIAMTREDALLRKVTNEEYQRAAADGKAWFVVNGQVYDGAGFLEEHPGGPDSITMVAGEDATEDFMAIHSETAKKMLADYHIGVLEGKVEPLDSDPGTLETIAPAAGEYPGVFLDRKKWKSVKLAKKIDLSRDVRLFEFAFDHPDQMSGLAIGQHVFTRLKDSDGDVVMRAYTPYSEGHERGRLVLLVKIYFPSGEVAGGRMTCLLEEMRIGDMLEVKGPAGSFIYEGQGVVSFKGKRMDVDRLYMVGGGSGITPHFQILRELVKEKSRAPHTHLLFGNKKEQDIMCREDLDAMLSDRIDVQYYLSAQPMPKNWPHKQGRVSDKCLDQLIYQSGHNTSSSMLLVCGPEGMVDTVKRWVNKSGFDPNRLVIF